MPRRADLGCGLGRGRGAGSGARAKRAAGGDEQHDHGTCSRARAISLFCVCVCVCVSENKIPFMRRISGIPSKVRAYRVWLWNKKAMGWNGSGHKIEGK